MNSNNLHTSSINPQFRDLKVTRFIDTFFKILESENFTDIICWAPGGERFIIKQSKAFTEQILQKYFGHQNLSSFIRQLYFYNFKRSACENNQHSFYHEFFKKSSTTEMLAKLRRNNSKKELKTEVFEKETVVEPQKKILKSKKPESWEYESPSLQNYGSHFTEYNGKSSNYEMSLATSTYESFSPSSELMSLLLENTLTVESALNDLRMLRRKLEVENSQPERLYSIEANDF
mmetsp:Transcript_56540/g.64805  ORF Transcript_56540/g.64805 Transcript_56540/m.64805 type:complete len:233 (-) Transcript_56540:211-909(-)